MTTRPTWLEGGAATRRDRFASQLLRFSLVGASGYIVNLIVYTTAVESVGAHYELGALAAFLVAVTNNYFLNRQWTFMPTGRSMREEATRFFIVSVSAFLLNAGLLALLVEGGVAEVPAQVCALAVVAPVTFTLNRIWTFSANQLGVERLETDRNPPPPSGRGGRLTISAC
jgi:putative flippase GtrA